MKINESNYFEASTGTFKVIPRKWTDQILAGVFDLNHCSFKHIKPTRFKPEIRLGNHKFTLNFVSAKASWQCFSIYYVSENKKYLIRVSDHWCESDNIKTKHLDHIARCFWKLEGSTSSKTIKYEKKEYDGSRILFSHKNHNFVGGIVAFDEMH